LLDHLPENLYVIISTRIDPSMPFARFRARDQLIEIRAVDLRFTIEETAVFLHQTMGLSLTTEDITSLEERTEGWIASLQLVALSMHGREDLHGFVSAFTGSHHYIVDYLINEVLNGQPDYVREFLLRTSILNRMNASLCDAITGYGNSQELLEKLEQENLFVIALDEERCWYRYHHLFADVLRHRLGEIYKNHLFILHSLASAWFEQNGWLADALHHSLAAGDRERAAGLVEQNALTMLMRGELTTLLDWINSVEALIPGHPWMAVCRVWAFTLTGQLDQAERNLKEAEQLVLASNQSAKIEDMLGNIAAIRAYQSGLLRDSSRAIQFSHEALRHLSESNLAIRSVVTLTLAGACWANGDIEGAENAYEEVQRTGIAAGNINVAVGARSSLGNLLLVRGELHQAFATYREALQLATHADGQLMPGAGAACAGLSIVSYEWNDLEAAHTYAQQSVELCQKWGSVQSLVIAYIILAQVLKAQGDLGRAEEVLNKAEVLIRSAGVSSPVAGWVQACRVNVWLTQGNLDAVEQWTQKNQPDISRGIPYLRSILNRTYIRGLLAGKKFDSVLVLLEQLLPPAESTGQTGTMIELLVLQALGFQANNELSKAFQILERALSLAHPEDYVRVFLDEGEPMAELLRCAGSQGILPKYVAKLLSEYDRLSDIRPIFKQPLIEPLSERELEVLRLIAEGLSNQAIAQRFVLSVGTVKAHTASIYRKLNVTSRTQAVARARELKLM
jgi:LuxR family maltose regulon positive regulatory protein